MKKIITFIFAFIITSGIFVQNANSQFTVTGSNPSSNGDWTTLTGAGGAFDKINSYNQTGKNIIITVNASSTSESGQYSLTGAAGMWNSLNIYTTGTYTIRTNSTSYSLINFYGADNVTIDGRVNQTGATIALTLEATGTGSSSRTIRFGNDATYNTIKYCKITGACTGDAIIFFASASTTGNSNNIIDNCEITSSTSRPLYAIYSNGGSGSVNNSNNIISNNKIYDFFFTGSATYSYGINIGANSTDWSITGNSFYETCLLAPAANVSYYVIIISSGNNHTISGNYIGGSSAQCGGAWTKTSVSNNIFYAIVLSVGTTTASIVQNNTIKGFNWSNSGAASFYGIYIDAGNVNIGTATGNIIGASTGNGSISLTNSTSGGSFYGVYYSGSGTGNIRNNIIGSVTTNNLNAAYNTDLCGMRIPATGTINISNNTIGSTTTANSLFASSASTGVYQIIKGIYSYGLLSTISISDNTIANLTNGTTYGEIISGIYTEGTGAYSITNNTIRDMNSVTLSAIFGIYHNNTGSSGQTITGNTIYNLSATSASFTGNIYGLYYSAGTSGTQKISENFIYGFSVNSNVSNSKFSGIEMRSGAASYSNNIINLGGNTKTTIYGIYESGDVSNNNNLYFNTVYIWGSLTSGVTNKSYALYSALTTNTRNIRNNIFYNIRSTVSGSSLHYAAYFNYSVSTNLTADYNDYNTSGSGGVLGYYGVDKTTLPIVTSQDVHSLNLEPLFNLSDGDGTSPWDFKSTNNSLKGAGISITGYSVDFSSYERPVPPSLGGIENDNPLPVELYSFTSDVKGKNVTLIWITSSEQNNAGFDIERKSITGSWVKVGFVQKKETVNTMSSYSFEDKNLQQGKYNYRLKQIDLNGNFKYFNLNSTVEIELPTRFYLLQNYPNPFNPTTKIEYNLPFDSKVRILIYDITGREIKTLINEVKTAGYYSVEFNAVSFTSGIYFYKIDVFGEKNYTSVKKMVLLK
jgi:hypothetical protein